MTPEEFTAKLEELRTVLADRLVDLEENPKWGTEDERAEVLRVLGEVGEQIEALAEALEDLDDEED